MNNIVLSGPHEGKLFRGVPEGTRTVIDYIRTYYAIFECTYYRTRNGFAFHSWRRIY